MSHGKTMGLADVMRLPEGNGPKPVKRRGEGEQASVKC